MTFEWAWVNTALILAVFVYGVRRWNGPDQNVRISTVEDEQKIIRGNLKRLERDVYDFIHDYQRTNDRMIKELEALNTNGAKERPLEAAVEQVRDQIFELERVINAMPCAMHALNTVNGKIEKDDD